MIGVGQYFVEGWRGAILRLYLFDPKRPILWYRCHRYPSVYRTPILYPNKFTIKFIPHDNKKNTDIHII